jgi:GNAT superfamily N-acetyltransferase
VTLPGPVCARLLEMPAALAEQGFALRGETEADVAFMRRLYVSTRWEELTALTNWTDAQKQAFLESQFALQCHHYLTYYASTDCAVLEKDGIPAGRLYVDRQASTLLVVDIALLPEWRGRGVGTALMEAVIAEARVAGKTVGITVEKYNPAQRLYRRLGFREVSDEGAHWLMEWRAGPDDHAEAQLNTAS